MTEYLLSALTPRQQSSTQIDAARFMDIFSHHAQLTFATSGFLFPLGKASGWLANCLRFDLGKSQNGYLRHLRSPLICYALSNGAPPPTFPAKCTWAVEKRHVPSSAESHWSQSEQTIVMHQNEEKSLQLIRTFQQQKETHWTATWHLFFPLLPRKFCCIWLAICERHKSTHTLSLLFKLPSAVLCCRVGTGAEKHVLSLLHIVCWSISM